MNTLILGGSGHVSGAVARAALAAGHDVWAVTRGQRPLAAGVRGLVADRHDDEALAAALSGAQMTWDLVVDCICYDLPDLRQDLRLFRDRAAQFVLISTDFVYDPARRLFPQPEDTPYFTTDSLQAYGVNKRRCELELIEGDTGALAWTVLRPCHIYGPTSELGCLPEHARDPQLLAGLRAGEALRLVGGGHFLQQPILADDLARTVVSVAGNPQAAGGIFKTAGPDILESRRYYEIIADVLGVELLVVEVSVQDYLAAHPEAAPFLCHRVYDLRRLGACGLAVPATPIAEGLRQHVEGLLSRA
jgi:nucleoside-diphosphate-sugar epimerase